MAVAIYGNEQYAANHTLQTVATTGTAWAAYMFTAPGNKTISTIMLAHRERLTITNTGSFSVWIRTGSTAGPTGGNLCGISFKFITGGATTLSRWQTIDVTDLAVSGGNTYCVVIRPDSATMGATAVFGQNMLSSTDVLTGYTFLKSADSGATWATANFATPPFIVNFSDGTTKGQVYSTVVTGGVNNNNQAGECFIVSGYATLTAGGVEIYVRRHPTTNPTGVLTMTVERTGVEIPNSTGTLAMASATTAGGWQIISFTSNITFTANEGFRIKFQAPDCTLAESYQINRLMENSSATVKDSLTWGQLSWACTSSNSGGAWTLVTGADISFKLLSATSVVSNNWTATLTDTVSIASDVAAIKWMDKKRLDTSTTVDTFLKLTAGSRGPTDTQTAAETMWKDVSKEFTG